LKFKVDENLPVECAEYLQAAGYDAETVDAEALSGSPDTVLFDHCRKEDRILVTLDLDFANVQASTTNARRSCSPSAAEPG
jgi:predicted nuclease of predicted toxin-antitoxin system